MTASNDTQTPQYLDREHAAIYVRTKFGISLSKNTLETLACRGGGPKFRKWGNRVYYSVSDLDQWVNERMARKHASTSDFSGGNHE
jgi:hypothetical protein